MIPRTRTSATDGADSAMRDRRLQRACVGLILALPLLMVLFDPRATARETAVPVFLTECVLAAGLLIAARERSRLLAEQVAQPRQPLSLPDTRGMPATSRRVTVGR